MPGGRRSRRVEEPIAAISKQRGLSQSAAARVLGIDQPKISRLVRGELYGFSIDQLIRLLSALGQKISFTIEPVKPPRKPAADRTTTDKPAARGKRRAKAA